MDNVLQSAAYRLLEEWCNALCLLQADSPGDPLTDGAIRCPACGRIHGRCHEAVYPLLFLAKKTGRETYLTAAKRLFDWSETLLQPDGSLFNDPENSWKGTTAFAATALHEALYSHGDLLSPQEKQRWEARLTGMGAWLYQNLRPGAPAYINYYAANACAMALLGTYFQNEDWLSLSRQLTVYCLEHVGESGLLYGEGRPHDARTQKGCVSVDVGYNMEESLPALYRCAAALGDEDLLSRCAAAAKAHLDYILPDGGLDNSFGTRAFKWTYWGSRTADGSTAMLFALGKEDPVFYEAARRRLELLMRCTKGGLLSGGPEYARAGEGPCAHHTFCQARSLAAALEAGLPDGPRVPLPTEALAPYTLVPETDTVRVRMGPWLADITAYDFYAKRGAHVSGGSMSLLWHAQAGPVLAAGPADEKDFEPLNLQPAKCPARHKNACMRVEMNADGKLYAQHRDGGAGLFPERYPRRVRVKTISRFCDENGVPYAEDALCTLDCIITPEYVSVEGRVEQRLAKSALFVLPVISPQIETRILTGNVLDTADGFSLTPGFCFTEYRVRPDGDGRFGIRLIYRGVAADV